MNLSSTNCVGSIIYNQPPVAPVWTTEFPLVASMKPVPFGKDTLLQLAVISLAPVAPLVLTMIPLGELLDRFLHVVF